jgi:AcrR family transcriptional regulator
MARTQDERKADTRARLLRAAAELFARDGIDAVSVDAVADAAGRTSGAVYAHFGSKRGLVTAVLDEWKEQVAVVVAAAFEAAPDLPSRLDALWSNFVSPPDERGDRWLLLEHELWLRAARDPEARTALAARYAEARRSMMEGGTWSDDADAEPAVPPEALPTLVLGLMLGLEMQRRLDPAAVPEGAALAGLLAFFGVRPPATAPAPIDQPTPIDQKETT